MDNAALQIGSMRYVFRVFFVPELFVASLRVNSHVMWLKTNQSITERTTTIPELILCQRENTLMDPNTKLV